MLVAIFRNRREAVSIPVRRVITENVFVNNNYITYDTSYHIKRGTRMLMFDKFRFDRKTAAKICLRGVATAQDRETETEPTVHEKMEALIDKKHSDPGVSKPRQAVGAKTFQYQYG